MPLKLQLIHLGIFIGPIPRFGALKMQQKIQQSQMMLKILMPGAQVEILSLIMNNGIWHYMQIRLQTG